MTREQLKDAVVAAARVLVEVRERPPQEWRRDEKAVLDALAALDALPAQPQPQGETVTLAVWVYPEDGSAAMFVPGSDEDQRSTPPWRRLGTVTLPLDREGRE